MPKGYHTPLMLLVFGILFHRTTAFGDDGIYIYDCRQVVTQLAGEKEVLRGDLNFRLHIKEDSALQLSVSIHDIKNEIYRDEKLSRLYDDAFLSKVCEIGVIVHRNTSGEVTGVEVKSDDIVYKFKNIHGEVEKELTEIRRPGEVNTALALLENIVFEASPTVALGNQIHVQCRSLPHGHTFNSGKLPEHYYAVELLPDGGLVYRSEESLVGTANNEKRVLLLSGKVVMSKEKSWGASQQEWKSWACFPGSMGLTVVHTHFRMNEIASDR